jgi:hypothetical protein
MENETGTNISKRRQVGVTLVWIVLWTLVLVFFALPVIWIQITYPFGLAYMPLDRGGQHITQEEYNESIGWFQLVRMTGLSCIPLTLLIWAIGLVLIVRRKRSSAKRLG